MNELEARKQASFYDGMFTGDYDAIVADEITKIQRLKTDTGAVPSIKERKQVINALVDAYVEKDGNAPKGAQVQRLADWLLYEELSNNHPDKVTREKYPFMTKRQLRTRHYREYSNDLIGDTQTKNEYLGGKKDSAQSVKHSNNID